MSHGNKEDYTIPALKDLTGVISCEPLQVSKVLSHLLEGKSPVGVHAMQDLKCPQPSFICDLVLLSFLA